MLLSFFVACLIPIITCSWIITSLYARWSTDYATAEPWRWAVSFIVALLTALYGLRRKSVNHSGFIAGIILGFLIAMGSFTFYAALLAFFLCGSRITKFRSSRKKKIEADFKEGGQRNWVQAISNAGPAAIFSVLCMMEVGSIELPFSYKSSYNASWYAMALMGSLAAACGDTFASEVGSVVGSSDPFLITAWRRVPRGTNGGISVGGTLGSLIGGGLVGLTYYLSLLMFVSAPYIHDAPPQWPIIFYGALAGGLGSVVDSIVGATLQFSGKHKKLGMVVEYDGPDVERICGRAILDNHSVNLVSCAITGLLMPYIAAMTWNWF